MALGGDHGTGEAQQPDDDDNHRIGVAEVEKTAAHLLQKKKNAHRYDDDGAAKAANRATLAVAMNMITHRF